jgi:hypothetical protein
MFPGVLGVGILRGRSQQFDSELEMSNYIKHFVVEWSESKRSRIIRIN